MTFDEVYQLLIKKGQFLYRSKMRKMNDLVYYRYDSQDYLIELSLWDNFEPIYIENIDTDMYWFNEKHFAV